MTLKWSFLIFGLVALAKAQEGYQRENPVDQLSYNSVNQRYSENDISSSGDEIPGDADKDYPIFGEIPETRFDCGQQQFPGYYADTETRCQVYHICQIGGRKDSFLCPNGTIFNQEKVICDWWFNFECSQAQNFYSINEVIVRAMEDADRHSAEKQRTEGYGYNAPSSSRIEQNKPSSSVGIPQSDFDTVIVEATRTIPRPEISQPQREIYERPEVPRHQHPETNGIYAPENDRKNSQITGAAFGKQISTNARDVEVIQEPGREYLPANKY